MINKDLYACPGVSSTYLDLNQEQKKSAFVSKYFFLDLKNNTRWQTKTGIYLKKPTDKWFLPCVIDLTFTKNYEKNLLSIIGFWPDFVLVF